MLNVLQSGYLCSDVWKQVCLKMAYLICCFFNHIHDIYMPYSSEIKVISYTASNPQDCSKWFTLYSLADLFSLTPSRLLCEASNHPAVSARRLFVNIYPLLSIARFSFIQLNEPQQCRVNKTRTEYLTIAIFAIMRTNSHRQILLCCCRWLLLRTVAVRSINTLSRNSPIDSLDALPLVRP